MAQRLSNQVLVVTKKLLFFILFILSATLFGAEKLPDDDTLKKMIGRMLIVGFDNERVDKNSKIIKDINRYSLGGVILFDRFYDDRKKVKNIKNPKQLRELTKNLQTLTNNKIIISVDQEGGKVARLKAKYGFEATASAKVVSELDAYMTGRVYENLAEVLVQNGINCDFAPVVDLAVNPKNEVIFKLKRSYGSDPKVVVMHAEIFMDRLKKRGILSVLKHFPGHGSSMGDSHKGFVDITDTWSEVELEPYKELIKKGSVDMIMTAHVFNKKLDERYPATLSHKINTDLLREKLDFDGVIISDDMQMKAISKHYNLKQSVTLSINSGVDILLFANQLAKQDTDELVETILKQVKNGSIPFERIKKSNERISKLHVFND
jgi:beta-N-acetylhexosaminidase